MALDGKRKKRRAARIQDGDLSIVGALRQVGIAA